MSKSYLYMGYESGDANTAFSSKIVAVSQQSSHQFRVGKTTKSDAFLVIITKIVSPS